MNSEFLRKERVTHIVNTAKGLEIFGPKYVVGLNVIYSIEPGVHTGGKPGLNLG